MRNHSVDEPRPTTRWANDLAVVTIGLVPVTFVIIALILAIGGPSPVKDAWTGAVGRGAAAAGLMLAVVAFLLALISKARNESWDAIWMPLALFPVLAATIVLTGLWVD